MRKSGILLSVSSLPGEYGIGDFGSGAERFVEFLHESGQSFWQVLPLCQTAFGDSPYQSPSVFAGNPYFISPERLYEQGLLTSDEERSARRDTKAVDYAFLWKTRHSLLRKAAERLPKGTEVSLFIGENREWLTPYALYTVLRNKAKLTESECMALDADERKRFLTRCREEIETVFAVQYLFFSQWFNLKKTANNMGVRIIGDIPIYTAYDSADVFDRPELFMLDEQYRPTHVAGCPPDDFSEEGQLWGNPVYRWSEHEREGFRWWQARFRHAARMYDAVRIDHFRGFYSGWFIPAGSRNAVNGKWVKAPGEKIAAVIRKNHPDLFVIAEDLGFITGEVRAFFEQCGFPGMNVMQFSFSPSAARPYAFQKNSVVYTGTHDNRTLTEWTWRENEETLGTAMDYCGVSRVTDLPDAVIREAMKSASELCIIPMSDWLGQGPGARMNIPGKTDGNWVYRLDGTLLTPDLAQKIRKTADIYGRNQQEET